MNAPRRNERRIVRDIAHARAGDKGNTSNVNVWAYEPKDFELLKRTLTPERIKQAFPHLIRGTVTRYELPHLNGLNFVLHGRARRRRQRLAQSGLARQVVELSVPRAGDRG